MGAVVGVHKATISRELRCNRGGRGWRSLTFQFKNREYLLTGQDKGYRLRGARVTVCEAFDGPVTVLHMGRSLNYRGLTEEEPPIPSTTRAASAKPWITPEKDRAGRALKKVRSRSPLRRSPIGKAKLTAPSLSR